MKSRTYDVRMHDPFPRWLPAEDALVREWSAAGFTAAEIAAMLGRTCYGVRGRRVEIGMGFPTPRLWTEAEERLVVELSKSMTDAELGRLIGRSRQAIANRRIGFLGLTNEAPLAWTSDELQALKNAFPLMPVEDVAAMIPTRTKKAIVGMAHRLGLRRRDLAKLSGLRVPLPPELREVIRLAKDLRKGIADEERRRSAGAAV